ncbi:DUF2141 domain-containing protein [Croceiramulus getboli]|nr:DUF2141 domain-containing protein [Flavobacteriaceae bacterium YJPT1-3]
MKTLVYLVMAFVTTLGMAQETEGVTITIELENVQSTEGQISAALYDENTFMKAAPLQTAGTQPDTTKTVLTFKNVAPGTYAIVTLHDFNSNGRMDFEANGMPKEPYGTSNNEMSMGPPVFADAAFEVANEDLTLQIRH